MTCTQPDCDHPVRSRGLCSRHYRHHQFKGTLDEVAGLPPSRPCLHCGADFVPKRWHTQICSPVCESAYHYEQSRTPSEDRECLWCSSPILKNERTNKKFCSDKCGEQWRNDQTRLATLAEKEALQRKCQSCGKDIAIERHVKSIYCSQTCKQNGQAIKKYGITRLDKSRMINEQGGGCAICGSSEWGGGMGAAVDHDHATGVVRGILCGHCNRGLGTFRDSPELLDAAAEYLRMHARLAP